MQALTDIYAYLKTFSNELGQRIVEAYPPVHGPEDEASPELKKLRRKPLPAQVLAIMGTAKFLKKRDAAKIVAECGTGKTIMSMATCFVHAAGKSFSSLVMCPPHLTRKWAREVFLTIPNARVFFIEDMRNGGDVRKPHGIVEVVLRNGEIERKGVGFSLTRLRKMGRKGWKDFCPQTAFFIMSKEKGKLSYFWRHAYDVAESGPDLGAVVSIDTGKPVELSSGGHLTKVHFDGTKHSENVRRGADGTTLHTALWQADREKIQRVAPLEYMGRYMKGFFDYSIADELHQLAGDTAQGNGLAVLGRVARKVIGMTGTLTGGYADDVYNVLYRMDGPRMASDGYVWGGEGRRLFQSTYGVQEEVVKRNTADNACSKSSKSSITIKRKPGCSPLLFGRYLMESTAFVSLEDIAAHLPAYNESVVPVDMDNDLAAAYMNVQEAIKDALHTYPRNASLTSIMLNTLLCYPDHPYDYGMLKGKVKDPRTKEMTVINICKPESLDRSVFRNKEIALLDDVKAELAEGRRVQVFATFTGEHDVTDRLKWVFAQAGLRVAVLKASVPTEKREAWYAARLAEGVQVVIGHPKLVETGLDLLEFPTIYFYETGYSLHTLRQASRRSWRIGQTKPVRIKFLMYSHTVQENQVKLMGKKLLVALMLEGKMSGEGLDGYEEDDDMMTSLVRELLENGGVGESADSIWKNLERERAIHTAAPMPTPEEVDAMIETIAVESMLPLTSGDSDSAPSSSLVDFAVAAAVLRKPARRSESDAGQLMLFA
jgi:hypothetical protein